LWIDGVSTTALATSGAGDTSASTAERVPRLRRGLERALAVFDHRHERRPDGRLCSRRCGGPRAILAVGDRL
jgi:hypothetical protein